MDTSKRRTCRRRRARLGRGSTGPCAAAYGDSKRSPVQFAFAALPGGVSSEIFRVDLPGGSVCVKRALPKLKVAADWRVPVERNRCEVEWMRVAGGDRARARFRRSWARTARRDALRWRICRPTRTPSGRICCGPAPSIRRRRPRSATCSAGFTPRRRIGPTSPRASRRTSSSTRFASSPISSATARAHPDLAPRLDCARRDDANDEARAGPRRLQPEEPVDRPGRAR